MPYMFTTQQLADFLGVSRSRVTKYRREGLIPAMKVRGIVRFPRPFVLRFVQNHLETKLCSAS